MHPFLSPFSTSLLAGSLDLEGSTGAESSGRRTPLIAGVLSGTSADGIDVVLAVARFESNTQESGRLVGIEGVALATEPFDSDLGERVRAALDGAPLGLGDLAELDRDLGLAFGAAARRVADRHDLGELVLVASHGQTVFHHDGDPARGKVTLQLGDGDFVAEAAGVAVVSDFRTRDCAAGGEGAPLVGLVDDVLFAAAPRPLAILNLGGISNWTILAHRGADPVAFDAGPAGALLDGLSRALLDAPFDPGGSAASMGTVDDRLVEEWLRHPFFLTRGPRSTGRDTFGRPYVQAILDAMGEAVGDRASDLLASACAFVAKAASRALAESLPVGSAPVHLLVAGGGIHNATLMAALEASVAGDLAARGVETASFGSSDAAGVPPDGREALAFAALGARFLIGEPSTSRAATGAAPGRILGKWSPAPPIPVSDTNGPGPSIPE
ncbi:Anhydro-N-acetylmuramic acid kinase [Planctomycetes bacterium Poly30]|uniref:Anhydro-N-acetylmuramic acid kinase n=1 Tax=Saltatorellus ferox TaxID=2528018 RepID=A0A518EUK1_9BACT|nr:Anhydro-N-acetylmuramic acid kinase [Planctomycetes bacterium Poly30]